MNREMQALCCECGNLRTCRRPRNRTYGFRAEGTSRELGELKCSACGSITRHALLSPIVDHRDSFEHDDAIARGMPAGSDTYLGSNAEALARLRDDYRRAQPQNPYLSHIWRRGDAADARERGDRMIRAYCGVMVPTPTPEGSRDLSVTDYNPTSRPEEYEGPDGEYWVDMECVDCARVANHNRDRRRAADVSRWMIWAIAQDGRGQLTTEDVDDLHAALSAVVARYHKAQNLH